jgi:hypothetical protein
VTFNVTFNVASDAASDVTFNVTFNAASDVTSDAASDVTFNVTSDELTALEVPGGRGTDRRTGHGTGHETGHGADGAGADPVRSWPGAVRQLIPTPAEHRDPVLDRAAALRLLGCDEATLDLLVSAGLPCLGNGPDARFDRYDLVNVAIYAGSGRSVPEGAQRFLMRYADGGPDRWAAGHTWAMQWALTCADPRCDGGIWRIGLPVPELFGGRYDEPVASTGTAIGPDLLEARGGTVRITAQVVTEGRREAVHSVRARRLYDELLADLDTERLRYQWMPHSLRVDVAAAVGNRTLDCVAAALLLERRGRELGLRTRTRQGLMLGMVSVDHAWMEFLDEDGRWRPLDPIFALLGGKDRADHRDAEFRDFCAGSVPGRFLPWNESAGRPRAEHSCPTGTGEWSETFLATLMK